MNDGTEVPAARRMVFNTLAIVEQFLAESGCLLTPEQRVAFHDARRHLVGTEAAA